jgi:hypothetical protein
MDHEDLIHHVDRSGCDRVEHVDFHSDLTDFPEWRTSVLAPGVMYKRSPEFNCGTWLSFVKWRSEGELLWRYPEVNCYRRGWGFCHDFRNPFVHSCSGWKSTKHKQGLRGVRWKDVTRVGVSISKEYWGSMHAYRGILHTLVGTKTFWDAVDLVDDGRLRNGESKRRIRRRCNEAA